MLKKGQFQRPVSPIGIADKLIFNNSEKLTQKILKENG